jgi:hypothetical protein
MAVRKAPRRQNAQCLRLAVHTRKGTAAPTKTVIAAHRQTPAAARARDARDDGAMAGGGGGGAGWTSTDTFMPFQQ